MYHWLFMVFLITCSELVILKYPCSIATQKRIKCIVVQLELERTNQRLEEPKNLMKYNSKCKVWLFNTATKLFFWALNVPEISDEDIMSPVLSQHTPKHYCSAGVDCGLTSSLCTPLKGYGNQELLQAMCFPPYPAALQTGHSTPSMPSLKICSWSRNYSCMFSE